MLPSFRRLLANSLNSLRVAHPFDKQRYLIRIHLQIFMTLFNFYGYLGLDSFPR